MKLKNFLKSSLKNWKVVGTLMPTFDWVAESIVNRISPPAKYIIEYGPGNGVITKKLLQNLVPDGKILAIEIVKDFVEEMENIKDPRLTVIHGDVLIVSQNLRNLFSFHGSNGNSNFVDVIISGIPFSYIPKKERFTIVENTYELLKEGGMLIVYQNTLLLLPILKKHFKKVEWSFEPLNVLPYFIMMARKELIGKETMNEDQPFKRQM